MSERPKQEDEAKLEARHAKGQASAAPEPDEARMSQIAKRLLSTPPEKRKPLPNKG